jgi:predicted ATP-grasp superfamily ATP-dependent carboligase
MNMPKKIQLDVENIIANNPKIDREAFQKSVEILKKLEQTGVVKPSTYSLETPDSRRHVKYYHDENQGTTLRLKGR